MQVKPYHPALNHAVGMGSRSSQQSNLQPTPSWTGVDAKQLDVKKRKWVGVLGTMGALLAGAATYFTGEKPTPIIIATAAGALGGVTVGNIGAAVHHNYWRYRKKPQTQ